MNYPWQNIKPKDTIILHLNDWLTELDMEVLTLLYKPILNQSSFGLFMTLKSLVKSSSNKSQEFILSILLTQIDIGIPEFYQARIRLEALGLLKVYRNKDSQDLYIYDLNKPLDAQSFFEDTILSTLLYEKVGESSFNDLYGRFQLSKENKNGYEDITKSFLDVFHFDVKSYHNFDHLQKNGGPSIEKAASPGETTLKESQFDWDFFYTGLNDQFVKTTSISDQIKELITTYNLMYGIDELTMQRHILEAADVESGKVDYDSLKKILQRAVRNFNKNRPAAKDKVEPFLEQKNDEKVLLKHDLKDQGYSDPEISIIDAAYSNTPGEYIKSIKDQKRGFVSDRESWTIKDLIEQSRLPNSVINIIIHYVLVIRNNASLDKNFALTIANDWAQKEIDTPEKALDNVKKLYQENQKRRQQKSQGKSYSKGKNIIRKESMPNWESNESDDESIDSESASKFRDQLKRIRESKDKEG